MDRLLLLALVGAVAQLIDGATGMAYGVTSATLMLLAGMAPSTVSASVHLAELPTTLLSGLAHWRLGNVRWPLALAIALPGAAGAWAGARLLGSLPGDLARPYVSTLLFVLGGYILWRFAAQGSSGRGHRRWRQRRSSKAPAAAPQGWMTQGRMPQPGALQRLRPLVRTVLAAASGFVDAIGGGGWGPLMTSGLLAAGRREVRGIIGSVDCSEFLVAVAASAGLLTDGRAAVDPRWVAALMAGGLVAAPLAAWLVSRLPGRVLGTAVGGLVMVTHAPRVLAAVGLPSLWVAPACVLLGTVWVGCGWRVWNAVREEQGEHAAPAPRTVPRLPEAGS